MDLITLNQLFYDLFAKYLFGDLWLGGIFGIFIMIYIGWKLRLSPDGWVILMAGIGILYGSFFFQTISLTVFILIGLGFLVFFLIRRIVRSY